MIVDNSNRDFILTSQDPELVFQDTMPVEDIIQVLKQVLDDEMKTRKCKYAIQLDKSGNGFDTNKLIELYRWLISLDTIQDVSNDSLILNVLGLLKTYNTFNDEYFNDPRIFFSSIEQFLDVKIALQQEIQSLLNVIGTYFISLFRSLSKTEYTILDSYVDIPDFFKALFLSSDLVTLSGMLATVPADYKHELKFVKGAHIYLNALLSTYTNANAFMTDFFERRESHDSQQ